MELKLSQRLKKLLNQPTVPQLTLLVRLWIGTMHKTKETNHGDQKGLEMLILKKFVSKVLISWRPTRKSKTSSGKVQSQSPKVDKKFLENSKLSTWSYFLVLWMRYSSWWTLKMRVLHRAWQLRESSNASHLFRRPRWSKCFAISTICDFNEDASLSKSGSRSS